jgi:methyl halide transferase
MNTDKTNESNIACCVVSCERPLDEKYWNEQYQANETGWDLGEVSPPVKGFIDTIDNKNISILIPGCGNSYEAEYLLARGFTNITLIDISPILVERLQKKFEGKANIRIVHGDFFEHKAKYDLIIEQTFFCALPPVLRPAYVQKMYELLNEGGMLAGLLFNKSFEKGPPFGGSLPEYEKLFKAAFDFINMKPCINSIKERADTEVWIQLQKKEGVIITAYTFTGITCIGCKNTITEKFQKLKGVHNVLINDDFSELLIVSDKEMELTDLQKEISYDAKYSIQKK